MSALLASTPCSVCADEQCGDGGCARFREVERLDARLVQIAALIAHEPTAALRRAEAEEVGDAYADLLGDRAARLDLEAWSASCNVRVGEAS